MNSKTPVLKIEKVSHRFSDGTLALDGIDLEIFQNDFLILSGPNGSGKSVLMKHLNGLLSPTSGKVLLQGRNIFENIHHCRQKIGLVFQDADSQIIGQTVEKDVSFGPENLRLNRQEIDIRVNKALNSVDLLKKKDHRPHILSGGEKRRLAIGGILAMNSEILIFDEPFSNLDYPGIQNVLKKITELHHEGHTIILITHDLGKVLAHANRLVIMNRGKIRYEGYPGELLEKLESCGIRKPDADVVEKMTWLK
jgi:biotin transport system ATP-binding protein